MNHSELRIKFHLETGTYAPGFDSNGFTESLYDCPLGKLLDYIEWLETTLEKSTEDLKDAK